MGGGGSSGHFLRAARVLRYSVPDGIVKAPALSKSCINRDIAGIESRMISRGLHEQGQQAQRMTYKTQEVKKEA